MYLVRFALILFIVLFQSCSISTKKNIRGIAYYADNCSRHLSDAIDFDSYKERIYAENVLDYHKYKNKKILIDDRYYDHPNFKNLSKDPDHNFKITPTSKLEAVSGIEAERLGLIASPIARGPPGSEFIDGQKNLWDVKTPISPLRIHQWNFNPEVAGNSILKKLKKNKRMHILLNKSFMSYKDKEDLSLWMKNNIPKRFKNRIIEVYFPSPFKK